MIITRYWFMMLAAAFSLLTGCDQENKEKEPLGDAAISEATSGDVYAPVCRSIPQAQPISAACCPSWGKDACGAGLFCAAFDGRTVPVCYAEHIRKEGETCAEDLHCGVGLFCGTFLSDPTPLCYPEQGQKLGEPCGADRHCASGFCNPDLEKCQALPGETCTSTADCAPDEAGNQYQCDSTSHKCEPLPCALAEGSMGVKAVITEIQKNGPCSEAEPLQVGFTKGYDLQISKTAIYFQQLNYSLSCIGERIADVREGTNSEQGCDWKETYSGTVTSPGSFTITREQSGCCSRKFTMTYEKI